MELYLYVVLLFGICLVHGLCRAFYDAGKERDAKYVIMLPEGFGKFRIVSSPYMPTWDIEKYIVESEHGRVLETRNPYFSSDLFS